MENPCHHAARTINERRQSLAETIAAKHYAMRPSMRSSYAETAHQAHLRDLGFHLSYLAEALATEQPILFSEYIAWVKVLLSGRNLLDDLRDSLEITRFVLLDNLPADQADMAARYLDKGLAVLPTAASILPTLLDDPQPHAALAREYLRLLLGRDRANASKLVLDAVSAGRTSVRDIYLHVFQRTQMEIGRLWQMNKISVAQEHYCTAATQFIMAQLYPYIFNAEPNGYRAILTCVSGELHEMGIRMVADFMEMDGWDTYYLGANVPLTALIQALEEHHPHILCISATMTFHISRVAEMIAAVRASDAGKGERILVGGYPFNAAPDLWRSVGADAHAPNALEAASIALKLLSEGVEA